jgi:hypothetical protein
MFDFGAAPPLAPRIGLFLDVHAADVARKIAGNAADLAVHALQYSHLVPILAAWALFPGVRRAPSFRAGHGTAAPDGSRLVASSGSRRVAALALAFAAVAAGAWATRDHARFLVIPLALAAAPAVVAGKGLLSRVSRKFSRGRPRRALAAAVVALSAAPLLAGHFERLFKSVERARSPEPDSVWGGPDLDALAARLRELPEGAAFAATSPWGLALASGRPGLLLPAKLDGWHVQEFLGRYSDVKTVVLRPGIAHDKLTPEPEAYADALAPIASSESVGRSLFFHRR